MEGFNLTALLLSVLDTTFRLAADSRYFWGFYLWVDLLSLMPILWDTTLLCVGSRHWRVWYIGEAVSGEAGKPISLFFTRKSSPQQIYFAVGEAIRVLCLLRLAHLARWVNVEDLKYLLNNSSGRCCCRIGSPCCWVGKKRRTASRRRETSGIDYEARPSKVLPHMGDSIRWEDAGRASLDGRDSLVVFGTAADSLPEREGGRGAPPHDRTLGKPGSVSSFTTSSTFSSSSSSLSMTQRGDGKKRSWIASFLPRRKKRPRVSMAIDHKQEEGKQQQQWQQHQERSRHSRVGTKFIKVTLRKVIIVLVLLCLFFPLLEPSRFIYSHTVYHYHTSGLLHLHQLAQELYPTPNTVPSAADEALMKRSVQVCR